MTPRLNSVEREAARWLVRREHGLNEREQEEFLRWCSEPGHSEAVNELSGTWSALDRPASLGKEALFESKLAALAGRSRQRRHMAFAGVSLAAAACLAGILWFRRASPMPSAVVPAANGIARVVQPEHQVLEDGSVVDLKPGSKIAVAYSSEIRHVTLLEGEALFQVVHDKDRPFVVQASGLDVRAIGTAFSVRLAPSQVEVLVTEGRVAVRQNTPPGASSAPDNSVATVDAGSRLVVASGVAPRIAPVSQGAMADLLSWRVSRLDLTDVSIAEAAAMFNARNAEKISVDSAVAQLRVTGVFRSDNVAGFAQALESTEGIQAVRQPDGTLRLRAAH